jgi:hypothetical protein
MSEIKNNLPQHIYRNTKQTVTADNYGADSVGTKIFRMTEGIEPRKNGAINFSAVAFTRT